MITNATITQINTPIDATPGGDAQFAPGEPVNIPCCLTIPMAAQRFQINQMQLDATEVVYILTDDLRWEFAGSVPALTGAQIFIKGDEETQPFPFLVRKNMGEIKSGGLSHVMLFCRQA